LLRSSSHKKLKRTKDSVGWGQISRYPAFYLGESGKHLRPSGPYEFFKKIHVSLTIRPPNEDEILSAGLAPSRIQGTSSRASAICRRLLTVSVRMCAQNRSSCARFASREEPAVMATIACMPLHRTRCVASFRKVSAI